MKFYLSFCLLLVSLILAPPMQAATDVLEPGLYQAEVFSGADASSGEVEKEDLLIIPLVGAALSQSLDYVRSHFYELFFISKKAILQVILANPPPSRSSF